LNVPLKFVRGFAADYLFCKAKLRLPSQFIRFNVAYTG